MTARQRRAERELIARLLARAPEIEQAILTRAYSLADPTSVGDPEYVRGLGAAVSAAVRHSIRGIEAGRAADLPIPVELLSQVRNAARHRVPLDTVLRRYVAGHTLLSDFIIEEARADRLIETRELQRLVRLQAELFDRVIEVVAAEYQAGLESARRSPGDDRAECVVKILAGQPADPDALRYELGGWHLALVFSGADVEEPLRAFARQWDRRLLVLRRAGDISWAWLGGARRPGREEFDRLAAHRWPVGVAAAVGEVGAGLAGWRLSHRQALAALPIALRAEASLVRYADVAVLASVLRDEAAVTSLRQIYLDPLEAERNSGYTLRETLRAYFAAERNVSAAAAALGVTRQTITNRLRVVEEVIQRPLGACALELDVALRLEGLFASAKVEKSSAVL